MISRPRSACQHQDYDADCRCIGLLGKLKKNLKPNVLKKKIKNTQKVKRAFSYFGPSVWNSLPLKIRNATTIDTFTSALKAYLYNLQGSD